jgi:hypothetical protein
MSFHVVELMASGAGVAVAQRQVWPPEVVGKAPALGQNRPCFKVIKDLTLAVEEPVS